MSNTISFQDAMALLRSMFGAESGPVPGQRTLEDEVIKSVLYANNGHLENTIDQLLVLSKDDTVPPVNINNKANETNENNDYEAGQLPEDFLRLPSMATANKTKPQDDLYDPNEEMIKTEQMKSDAQIARNLQRQYEIEQALVNTGLGGLVYEPKVRQPKPSHPTQEPHYPDNRGVGHEYSHGSHSDTSFSDSVKKKFQKFKGLFSKKNPSADGESSALYTELQLNDAEEEEQQLNHRNRKNLEEEY